MPARVNRSLRTFWLALPLLPGVVFACHNPVDQEAKQRIFSPEEPPKYVTRAAENLDPAHLDSSPEHIERVFGLSAAEAAEREGQHAWRAHVEYVWTGGEKQISLDEDHELKFGTKGDFWVRLNDGDKLGESKQGMELVRAQGKVFARSRFGHFRERDRDRGAAEKYRDEVYGVLPTVYEFFDGRIALRPSGSSTVGGRTALKYAVALADAAPKHDAGALPPEVFPKDGPDAHLQREMKLDKSKQPRSIEGTIAVDAETGVVLEATLTGTIEVPADRGPKSVLNLKVDLHVSDVNKDQGVAPPKDALPDEGRPQGIAAALERFDLPRVHKDAGAEESKPDEPDDDEPAPRPTPHASSASTSTKPTHSSSTSNKPPQ